MAYGDFTLDSVLGKFNLRLKEHPDLFAEVKPLPPSDWLATFLKGSVPLARAVNTEKGRSEWIIAPVLADVRLRYSDRCSLFSGIEFNVDPAQGLRGFCDFILSRSPIQHLLTAPAVMIAESKNADLTSGYGQCIAGMIAARIFNQRSENPPPITYGAVSTGELWGFLELSDDAVTLDMNVYTIDNVEKILGILVKVVLG